MGGDQDLSYAEDDDDDDDSFYTARRRTAMPAIDAYDDDPQYDDDYNPIPGTNPYWANRNKKARAMTAAVTVPVGSRYGLHTTPSMLISNKVKSTGWPVYISDQSGNKVDARDPMALISLGVGPGGMVTVHCDHPQICSDIADYVALNHD